MSKKMWSIALIILGSLMITGGFGGSFSIFPGIVAVLFGWRMYQNEQKKVTSAKVTPKFELTDELIIRLANRLGGKLSVEDLTTQTSLNTQQAQERLDKLFAKGICRMDLDRVQETGKIYYYFD